MRRFRFSKVFFKKRKKFKFPGVLLLLLAVIFIVEFIAVEGILYNRYVRKKETTQPVQKFIIRTDKLYYTEGEIVEITINNQTPSSMQQKPDAKTRANIKTRKSFGSNYGIGLIEKKLDGSWIAVEPVWRCGNSCFKVCDKEEHLIDANNNGLFRWGQNMLICDNRGNSENKIWSGVGKYRVTAAVWSEEINNITIIHSKEFVISNPAQAPLL